VRPAGRPSLIVSSYGPASRNSAATTMSLPRSPASDGGACVPGCAEDDLYIASASLWPAAVSWAVAGLIRSGAFSPMDFLVSSLRTGLVDSAAMLLHRFLDVVNHGSGPILGFNGWRSSLLPAASFAITLRMPLASISKVTSIFGAARAGGILPS